MGAFVAFGIDVNKTTSTGVSNAVYGTFVAIMVFAVIVALLCIQDPKHIVRDDGTHLARFEKPSMSHEFHHLKSLMTDWKVLCLIVPLFVAEMCLAVVSTINAYYFNLRTRSLNNVLYEFIMIPTAILLSMALDGKFVKSRRSRGMLTVAVVGLITMAASAGLTAWEKINHLDGALAASNIDWTDSNYAGGCVIYLLWGIVYASYVVVVQWVMASMSNDPDKLAFYAGFTKGTNSLGLCISFVLDVKSVTYFTQTIIQFVLYGVGTVIMFAVVYVFVKETNYFQEENVIVPLYIEGKLVDDGFKPGHLTTADTQAVAQQSLGEKNM